MTITIPEFKLATTNASIPAIGFGSGTAWQRIKKTKPTEHQLDQIEELIESVSQAISVGFRHIDTAETYTTHEEVGLGIKRSGIKRAELFITDKYSPSAFPRTKSSGPYESLKTSLKELGVDYVDLYLIHSPTTEENAGLKLEDAWKQIERAYNEGLTKNVGVSNFSVEYLERILKVATVKPQVNQIEFHPYLQEQSPGIIQFGKDNGILIEAYAPLTPITRTSSGPLDDILPELVKKYGKTESQILLRWVYQNGVLPLTTSSKINRLEDALDIFSFELEKSDFELIKEVGSKKLFRSFAKGLYGKYDSSSSL